MAALPVQGIFIDDFVVHLVLIDTDDTIDEAAAKIADHAVGRRIFPSEAPMRLRYGGEILDGAATVADSGIGPLQMVHVLYDD